MGHFHNTIRGEGKNRLEAQHAAVDEFIRENGTRHSVRDVSQGRLVETLPPMGVITKDAKGRVISMDYTRRNQAAPKEEWVQVWEFELHTHA